MATLFNLKYKKPLVVSCHGQLKFGSRAKDIITRAYDHSLGSFVFKRATRIAAISESDKKYIASLGVDPAKIVIIPSAVSRQDLDREFSSINAVKEPGITKVIFVGAVNLRKGVDSLVKAAASLAPKYPGLRVVVIGGGPYLEQGRSLADSLNIGDRVTFTGRLSREDVIKHFKTADIFTLPSLSEGFPLVIIEAMYFGLPIVATAIPGLTDYLTEAAVLVPPKNEIELAAAMEKLIKDVNLRRQKSALGKQMMLDKFQWDVVFPQFDKMFRELAEAPSQNGSTR